MSLWQQRISKGCVFAITVSLKLQNKNVCREQISINCIHEVATSGEQFTINFVQIPWNNNVLKGCVVLARHVTFATDTGKMASMGAGSNSKWQSKQLGLNPNEGRQQQQHEKVAKKLRAQPGNGCYGSCDWASRLPHNDQPIVMISGFPVSILVPPTMTFGRVWQKEDFQMV